MGSFALVDKKSISCTSDIEKKTPKSTNNCGLTYTAFTCHNTDAEKNLGNPKTLY